ncbi:MAG TPA: FGGY-family carbohydrate kinase, partial [Solirubrobacterales bacterium]|nr:FGGY-family carbohydrate kinase [Solirubrobacterales bacterium]
PLLAGERGPGYAVRATGAISGLTQATTAAEILQAGLEGVALQLARLDRDLDRSAPGAELIVASGAGLLHNRAWMQMLADATGRPVGAGGAREASARGAAFSAFEAAGLLSENDLARLDPGIRRPLAPTADPETRNAYERAWRRQEALYRAVVSSGRREAGH